MENEVVDPKADIKAGIKAVEGLFHACNDTGFKLKWHDAVLIGMKFLNECHVQLIGQLSPEEIESEKNKSQEPLPAVVN